MTERKQNPKFEKSVTFKLNQQQFTDLLADQEKKFKFPKEAGILHACYIRAALSSYSGVYFKPQFLPPYHSKTGGGNTPKFLKIRETRNETD